MKQSLLLAFLLIVTPCFASGGQIALTFDDVPRGNSNKFTAHERVTAIINKLKAAGVPQVAFFVNTINFSDASGEQYVKQYADAGHLIANHSHSHMYPETLGAKHYIQDIEKADSILSSMEGFTRWYRYPYLDKGGTQESLEQIQNALKKMGYFDAYVTVETYDWHPDKVLNQALEDGKEVNLEVFKQIYISHIWQMIQFHDDFALKVLGRSPKHILLLHENDLAALFVDDLIATLRAKGWEIISPEEAYADPIATQKHDITHRSQKRIDAIAKLKGYQYVRPQELNEAYLDELMEKMGAVDTAPDGKALRPFKAALGIGKNNDISSAD